MPVPGQFHKTTCVKECKSFDADYEIRTAEIKLHYANILTGDAPATKNQFDCKTNPVVNQCYGKYPEPGNMLLNPTS